MSYLQSLSVFWTVVDEGSFSGAAKRLALTQPTISFHIDNLEKRFSVPLFTRTAKGVAPTVYGRTLYESTVVMQNLATSSENKMRSLADGRSGHIKIGASTVPAHYILPQIIGDFLQQEPGIRFSLTAGDSSSILQQFETGEFPIAIVGFPPSSLVTSLPIFRDELILVAHPDYPMPSGDCLSASELGQLALIVREPTSGSRKTLVEALCARGIVWDSLRIAVEAGGNEACKELIRKKVGIGFLSYWAVASDLETGQLRRLQLENLILERSFYALVAKPLLPAALETFWTFLTNYALPDSE